MYSNVELGKLLCQLPVIAEIDDLRKKADELRPGSKDGWQRVMQKFRLDWNYHSNAIEGNPYTYGETVALIMEGLTAKGKTLKDHLDIKGQDDAIKYMLEVIKDSGHQLTEYEIRNIHKILLKEPYTSKAQTSDGQTTTKTILIGQYKETPNHVKTLTGEMHYYASVEDTKPRMTALVDWLNEAIQCKQLHPLVMASLFHHEFVAIHPFDDGNGRMTRLFTNLVLMRYGYPPIVVKQQDRNNYYAVLRRADAGEYEPIVAYFGNLLCHSLGITIRALKGEPFDEPDDIDKEISLLKKSLDKDKIHMQRSEDAIKLRMDDSVDPLFSSLISKLSQLDELFFSVQKEIGIKYFDFPDDKSMLPYAIINPGETYAKLSRRIRDRKERVINKRFYSDGAHRYSEYSLVIKFEGLKKSDNASIIPYSMKVLFDEYRYRVVSTFLSNEYGIRHKYDEPITADERNRFVVEEVRKVLKVIDAESKV
jgi:fido (protein-threonine AMPylation protein)